MEKEFIPYEQALALKELRFDDKCVAFYRNERQNCKIEFTYFGLEKDYNHINSKNLYLVKNEDLFLFTSAPLYQQAFRWFREKYELDVTFRKMDYGPESQFTGYYFSVYKGNGLIDIHGADKKCKVYEDSELECLKKLIEIVKNK